MPVSTGRNNCTLYYVRSKTFWHGAHGCLNRRPGGRGRVLVPARRAHPPLLRHVPDRRGDVNFSALPEERKRRAGRVPAAKIYSIARGFRQQRSTLADLIVRWRGEWTRPHSMEKNRR
jgi:hypothetical protein